MKEYTASNGIVIRRRADGVLALGDGFLFNAGHEAAWREFFQHERDEELGRWRWPENPDVVVYLDGHPSRRSVTIFFEKTGGIVIGMAEKFLATTPDEGHESRKAARAYFEAHPERKPWEDAQTGEVWVLTLDGDESAWSVSNKDVFENPDSTLKPTSPMITAGRRIWPEGEGYADEMKGRW